MSQDLSLVATITPNTITATITGLPLVLSEPEPVDLVTSEAPAFNLQPVVIPLSFSLDTTIEAFDLELSTHPVTLATLIEGEP